ncbi:MAG: 1,4-dihydroxy-2-naphthoate polyprenyltransferase [Halobacteriales archaeon]
MDDATARTTLRAWWTAARVHTLPAGASPVVVGTAVAHADGVFSPLPALAALVGALLIQVGTNFANDYADAVRGVDAPDRAGFTRVTAAGWLPPRRVLAGAIVAYAAAILLGAYLVYVGGVPIVVVGLSSVAFGFLYSGGPWPYGYRGLGDLFVFVYFGVVAVVGTYYVQAADVIATPLAVAPPPGTIAVEAVVASLAMGGLTTAILVVNNVRDLEEDAAAGKRTLAVILGRRWSRVEFVALLVITYLVPVWFAVTAEAPSTVVVFATIPLAVRAARPVLRTTDGEALNRALSAVDRLTLTYAVLFAAGVVL